MLDAGCQIPDAGCGVRGDRHSAWGMGHSVKEMKRIQAVAFQLPGFPTSQLQVLVARCWIPDAGCRMKAAQSSKLKAER